MKIVFFLLVIFALMSFASDKKPLLTAKYCGTYCYFIENVEYAYGCVDVYPETDTTILFYLSINNGPPAYHIGQLYGRAHLLDGAGMYNSIDSDDCRYKFSFSQDTLILESIDEKYSCLDFGANISAGGAYMKRKSPCENYFIDEGNDTTYFGVPPETWGLRGVNK